MDKAMDKAKVKVMLGLILMMFGAGLAGAGYPGWMVMGLGLYWLVGGLRLAYSASVAAE